jgi:hypothetical protein
MPGGAGVSSEPGPDETPSEAPGPGARVAAGWRSRITVAVLVAVLVVYFVLLGDRAVLLISSGRLPAVGLGLAVFALPVIGAVTVGYELNFGRRTQQLAAQLAREGDLPDVSDLPRRPSGRIERDAADAHFEVVKARVEADESDWRGWYHLADAYDVAGDRKRARETMRHAIELYRTAV